MANGPETVVIFDTTLRDGEQAPGFTLDVAAKVTLARALDALGVDIIEAGFPIASPADAEAVRQVARALFSAHCHDDLGLAHANSIAGIQGGARQVECTINGIGERAGNAALEEIVEALRVRAARLRYDTAIKSTALYETSQMLSQLTQEPVQANKAIVGRNAFAHEAG